MTTAEDVHHLAGALGIETEYWDVRGVHHRAAPDIVMRVAEAMGAPLEDGPARACEHVRRRRCEDGLDPVTVVFDGERPEVSLFMPVGPPPPVSRLTLTLEDGSEESWDVDLDSLRELARVQLDGAAFALTRLDLGGPLPPGYHDLTLWSGDQPPRRGRVISAPRRAIAPDRTDRIWGVFAPLYAMWTTQGTGPDVSTLDRLARWTHELGGRMVATLPLLSTFAGQQPFDPSPYAPVSRRFWNELYLDLAELPGRAASSAARDVLATDFAREVGGDPAGGRRFDHRTRAALVRRVVDAAARAFFARDERAAFDRYVQAHPDVVDYARFRAAADALGTGWRSWPERAREGDLSGVPVDPAVVEHHLYAQWAMRSQLEQVASSMRARDQRLYLDLPVGSHAEGFDTWAHQQLFAPGMATGAPPDDFFEQGQNWGFPPPAPARSRQEGHAFFAGCVAAHMQVAGTLRLDHVMQLQRLYWVPDGAPATDGVYVRYPHEELMAVLTLESSRSGCTLVGEDLGTVPDEIRHSMHDHALSGMYVLEFESPEEGEPRPPRHDQVASVDTHDTPTFAAFARALDVQHNLELGFVDGRAAGEARDARKRRVANLTAFLERAAGMAPDAAGPDLVRAALAWLAASESAALLITLDDLWDEVEPQNVPGTGVERPNWVLRWPRSLEELEADLALRADLEAVQAARLDAHLRAVALG